MAKRYASYGAGRVEERGAGRYRLRYSIDGIKYATTVSAKNKTDAQEQLRKILGAKEAHVEPSKQTVGQWIADWLELGAPGRRRKRVSQQTLERYEQLMLTHVVPAIEAAQDQKGLSNDWYLPRYHRSALGVEGKASATCCRCT
jgi:integrase